MEQHILFGGLIAFITTVISLFILKPLANKFGLVDLPGGRKLHSHPTPLIGGIGMFMGVLIGTVLMPNLFSTYHSFIVTGFLILIVGVLDDLHDISAQLRILLQCVALAMMTFWGGVSLEELGTLFGDGMIVLGVLSFPITLFGAATLINAVNMSDGVDGLAGSLSLLAFLSLTGIAYLSRQMVETSVLTIVCGAVLAFLCFNFPWWPTRKASVFMGDAGSTFIGLILAWFTIHLSQIQTIASPAIMLWIVMLPLMDLAAVFIRRLKSGRSPFKHGHDHLQNILQARGFSRVHTVWLMTGIAFLGQCVAWMLIHWQLPDALVFSLFIILFIAYLRWNLRNP